MSTILFIPGIWRSAAFPALAASLSQAGHEVVSVRLPGDEGSGLPEGVEAGRFTWDDAVAAVETAIAGLPAGTLPTLIGEGAGGYLAQIVAARRQTGPVVLLNSPAPVRGRHSPLFFVRLAAREMIGHAYRGAFRAMFSLSGRTRPAVTAPVLIRSSEGDRLVSRRTSLDLLALYPQADFQRSADDSTEKLCRDIADWIAALAEENAAPATLATFPRRRALHHGAPVPGRRDAPRIPLQASRVPLRRASSGTAGTRGRDRAADAVPDALGK
jgi:alpha-beta hydrolase superfamily lysophospholipase